MKNNRFLSLLLLASVVTPSATQTHGIINTISHMISYPFGKSASLSRLTQEYQTIHQGFHPAAKIEAIDDLIFDYNSAMIAIVETYNAQARTNAEQELNLYGPYEESDFKTNLENRISQINNQPYLFYEKELKFAISELYAIQSACEKAVARDMSNKELYESLLAQVIQLQKDLHTFYERFTNQCHEYTEELSTGRAYATYIILGAIALATYTYLSHKAADLPEVIAPAIEASEAPAVALIQETAPTLVNSVIHALPSESAVHDMVKTHVGILRFTVAQACDYIQSQAELFKNVITSDATAEQARLMLEKALDGIGSSTSLS